LKRYDSARVYIQQALEWVYQHKSPRNLGWFLSEMGNLYGDTGEYPLALTYFRTSNVQSALADDYFGLNMHYIGMANVFEKTGELDSSFFYSKKALVLAQQTNMTKRAMDASSYLATLYQKKYNADSALRYMVLTRTINDSLFSQQNQLQLQSLTFNEQVREQEKEEAQQKAEEERAHNLQYAAIALGLVTLLIGFLVLSHTVIAGEKLIRFLGIVSLLIVFEFLNLLLHPWIGGLTHHSPVWMLLIMVCVAALLVPLHHKLEHWVIHRLVEKNNKIRVAAARKAIQKLESKVSAVPVEKGTDAQQEL
jgi:tetratricopeptide (TPR) repeat protein